MDMTKIHSFRAVHPTKWITITALLMAMNIIMSSFSIPVPGGHLYLNDAVICTAALLLDPLGAFLVGGVGAFLGDFFFYPAPMLVSLVTHGLQGVIISLCAHAGSHRQPALSGAVPGLVLGTAINVVGYSLGRSFLYATVAAALLKLPFQIFQASFGAIVALLLCFPGGLSGRWDKFTL